MQSGERTRALLEALLVTFLWSTSWILIKQNIDDIPPLTFAAVRYTVAFLALLPGLRGHKFRLRKIRIKPIFKMILLGLVFYTLTQGGNFLTLKYLPATSFSLILNFSSVLVAILGIYFLSEKPTVQQWGGIVLFIAGVFAYFFSKQTISGTPLGYLYAVITVIANAVAAVLGRSINREKSYSPYVVTVVSMGTGAIGLLAISLSVDGLWALSIKNVGVILWLALVNTAFAFTLWNKTLRVLSAAESSIINNTMLLQIALLSWLFLGESFTQMGIIGLAMAFVGLVVASVKPQKPSQIAPEKS